MSFNLKTAGIGLPTAMKQEKLQEYSPYILVEYGVKTEVRGK
jgi:hypothetical protein